MKSLKEQVEDLEISQPQELDPEDDPFAKRDHDSDSDEAPSEAGITGREHYEAATQSNLRKAEEPVLGKQYAGASVSRKTLFDNEGNMQEEDEDDGGNAQEGGIPDEDDDPFARMESRSSPISSDGRRSGSEVANEAASETDHMELRADVVDMEGEDPEIDSDEAFGSGDESAFKSKGFMFRGSKKDPVSEDFAEEGDSDEDGALMWDTEDEEQIESGEDLDMADISSDSNEKSEDVSEDESQSDSNTSTEPLKKSITEREKLKALLANDAAAVASTLSASANADAQKGRAVKQQYQTFDRLLDARIKLQKGLTAANSIHLATNPEADVSAAVQAAEAAALKLFSTIELIRHSMSEALDTTSKKRKRPSPPNQSTSTSTLWTRMSNLEEQDLPRRRTVLNKWSMKTRSANGLSAPRSQLDRTTHQDTISDILDAQITSENHKSTSSPSGTYDDTAFYQSLLRELISSRASLSQSGPIADMPLPSAPKQHRKGVDTKASKGRKVRYTVHEKLQNFTAEEERGTWTESARREFFASLFGGQGRVLDEHDEMERNGDADEGLGEEGALKLFRN